MKTCSRCKIKKDESEFRMRKDKRKGGLFYLNNTCRQCDKEIADAYYNKKKDDPEFKRKNIERAKAYKEKSVDKIKLRKSTIEFKKKYCKWNNDSYYRMKDVIAAKMKIKRQTPEYKKRMKEYRKKNKEKIDKQEAITKKRHQEKIVSTISDAYIVNHLGLTTKDLPLIKREMPELLELKREQIKLSRAVKKHKTSTKKGIVYGTRRNNSET